MSRISNRPGSSTPATSATGRSGPRAALLNPPPLFIDGVLYLTTPFSRVIALDAETGREIWSFDPHLERDRPGNLFINRGASYWTDGHRRRVFLGTMDGRLFSLVAQTGKPDSAFGVGGWIDLRPAAHHDFPDDGITSPPAIYKTW